MDDHRHEKTTEAPPKEQREAEEGHPPKYDNASEQGTIADGGHSAAAIGETGAKGERLDG